MAAGYPMAFSLRQGVINLQFQTLAEVGQLPSTWSAKSKTSHWNLTANIGPAYIDSNPDYKSALRLSFPVITGTFTTTVLNDDDGVDQVPYQLDGMIFSFVTPTKLLSESQFSTGDLNANHLFLDLDSPNLQTIVDTSKAVSTQNIDGIKVQLEARIQDYVRQLAKDNSGSFILTNSITSGKGDSTIEKPSNLGPQQMPISPTNEPTQAPADTSGTSDSLFGGIFKTIGKALAKEVDKSYLVPSSADYSIFEDIDSSYSENDPRYSNQSAVNWLLSIPGLPSLDDTATSGQFDTNPIPSGKDAAATISGYAIATQILLPAIIEKVNPKSNTLSYSVNGDPWVGSMSLSDQQNMISNMLKNAMKSGIMALPEAAKNVETKVNSYQGWMYDFNITPASSYIEINWAFQKTVSKDYIIVSSSTTVNATFTTRVTFSVQDAQTLVLNTSNTQPNVQQTSKDSILGIPLPNFISNFMTGLLTSLSSRGTGSGLDIRNVANEMISRVKILGGTSFNLSSADVINGNLVMGLMKSPATWISADQESSVKSIASNTAVNGIAVHNMTAEEMTITWIDYDGNMHPPTPVSVGGIIYLGTYATNVFTVRDKNQKSVGLFRIEPTGRSLNNDIYLLPFRRYPDNSKSVYQGSKINTVTFNNGTGTTVILYWIDNNGNWQEKKTLMAGQSVQQQTWVGYVFGVLGDNGQVIGVFKMTSTGDSNGAFTINL